MNKSKFNTKASYETTDEEIGVYYPVFYDAFAWSAQSAETLQHALQHTDQKR